MAVTAALVFSGHNRLRYLLTQDGNAGTTLNLTTSGAATPDVRTDSLAGPIKNIALAPVNGYGLLAAGALTQAQARALYLSDPQSTIEVAGNASIPLAVVKVLGRAGGSASVDANVSAGVPVLAITMGASASTAYLDIEVEGAIGA